MMNQAYPSRDDRAVRIRRKHKRAGVRLAFIGVLGAASFVLGFFLLWALGSVMVGGPGFPGGSDKVKALAGEAFEEAAYEVSPLVDLLAFRDLSYVPVKGVHVTSYAAGSEKYLDRLFELADTTEINAFVVDVKDDTGYVAYESDLAIAEKLGLTKDIIGDIEGLLARMGEHDVIPIARIVCFKDDILTKKRPDLAIQKTDGSLWRDSAGHAYLNPYNHEAWEYLVQVAEEAARLGFREIQFDYVRFPTDGDVKSAVYPGNYCLKEDAVAGFLAYAKPRLEKLGVWVSADVYGLVVRHQGNAFGQQLEKMCRNIDIVCPMVYPSHYDSGSYGAANPNSEPYTIVSGAMKDARDRLAGTGAECRPYLQDFYDYSGEDIKAQIQAAEEQGFDEWLLWDPNVWYTDEGLAAQ